MAYNRYNGNTGRVERVEDLPSSPAAPGADLRGPSPPPGRPQPPRPRPVQAPPASARRPGLLGGMTGELGRLLQRLSPMNLEAEDLLLILILYLLYRESGDEEFLIMIGGLLFF